MQIVLKDRGSKTVIGKLSFIDLAGSERGADRGETDVKTRYIHFFFNHGYAKTSHVPNCSSWHMVPFSSFYPLQKLTFVLQ